MGRIMLLLIMFLSKPYFAEASTACGICDALTPTPSPTVICFNCNTRVQTQSGEYKPISSLLIGEKLQSTLSEKPVVVRNVSRSLILPHQRGDILTVHPHACGKNQPFESVEMTRHHAIRCPKLMEHMDMSIEDRLRLHIYPYNLPSNLVSFESDPSNTHVCNVDVGNPEIPLVVQGMLAESWDGFEPGEIRRHTWRSYNDTLFMMRMRSTAVDFSNLFE